MQAATCKPVNCNIKGKKKGLQKFIKALPGFRAQTDFLCPGLSLIKQWEQLSPASALRRVLQVPLSPTGVGPMALKHTLLIWQVVKQRGKWVGGTLTSKAVTWVEH